MREHDYHVHFGKPYVWQERNVQNLTKNLKDEVLGVEFTSRLIGDINDIDVGSGHIVDQLRRLYAGLANKDYLPPVVQELGQAWCDDISYILDKA